MVERSWCPHCKRWVPSKEMNYDVDDDDGRVIRMCNFCMEGTETSFIEEPYHESVQCIYCDSYNTIEQTPQWGKYVCKDCGATFRRF